MKASKEDVVDIVDAADPVIGTGGIVEQVEASRRTVRRRLGELLEDGLVERQPINARTDVWYTTDAPDLDGTTRKEARYGP